MTKQELAQKIKVQQELIDAHNRHMQSLTRGMSDLDWLSEAELEAIATELENISTALHLLWINSANILSQRIEESEA